MPRITPSLKWMIDKRGRIDGDIQRIERHLKRHQRIFERFQKLNDELLALKDVLASIDKTLSLHEIQVVPENIPTILSHKHKCDMPYGEMAKSIYMKLSLSKGQPVSSKEIVAFVLERKAMLGFPSEETKEDMKKVRMQVKRCLQRLHKKGGLVRYHPLMTRDPGWWSLSSDAIQDTQNATDGLVHTP